MQLIEAIINPAKLTAVEAALSEAGFYDITVTSVLGRGHFHQAPVYFQGSIYEWDLDQRLKVEFVIEDNQTEQAVGLIERSAWSGRHGDGSIFVIPVANVI